MAAERPVIMIPGFLDTPRLFRRMDRSLRAAGHRTAIFELEPSTGARGMDELAEDLVWFVDEVFPGEKIGLVGFSMGGIVARYWAQRLGGAERTDRLITLATPHHGTATAHLIPLRGIRQLRLRSQFLEELNSDRETLRESGMVSFWSPLDLMTVPPWSARLGFGDERRVAVIHGWMPRSRPVIEEVLRLLATAEGADPAGAAPGEANR